MKTSAFNESRRITKLLFNEVYGNTYNDREEFDNFVMNVVRNNKIDGAQYTFHSLYLYKNYTFHINVVYENCFSPTTFIFNMVWDDSGFNCECSMDNIATYIGTPGYWFSSRKELRTAPDFVDEKIIEL